MNIDPTAGLPPEQGRAETMSGDEKLGQNTVFVFPEEVYSVRAVGGS